MDTDILVIGASPAGVAAATRAAKSGASVMLLDKAKKDDVATPPHPANTFFKFMFDRAGEEVIPDYVKHYLTGMKIISPAGHTIEIETPGYSIERKVFDRYYLDRAKSAGVESKMGVGVTGVEKINLSGAGNGENGFTAMTDDGEITASILVVADGIESNTARLLGMDAVRYPQDIAWAVEVEIEADGIGKNEMFEYYLGDHAPGWKSTYSPFGGNRATLGLFARRQGRDVSASFDAWFKHFCEMKGLSDVTIIGKRTGGDPIATIPKEIVAEGIMITGGAAGQSGIGYGMRAGQMCGDVAAKAIAIGDVSKNVLMEYRRQWNHEFRSEYWLGRIALEAMRKMNNNEIDNLAMAFMGADLSSLKGSPLKQGILAGLLVLKRKPTALLGYGALLRRR